MTEKSIMFMFVIGCGTVLAMFALYIIYRIEKRERGE
jgi:hypothetical protein